MPPLRLFLISLLLFMLALEGAVDGLPHGRGMTITIRQGTSEKVVMATPRQAAEVLTGEQTPEQIADASGEGPPRSPAQAQAAIPHTTGFRSWLRARLERAWTDPEYFGLLVFTWAHRLAFLLLPIFAAQLALLYARRDAFYFHDHLVVSMLFLSFAFLITGLAWLPFPFHHLLAAGAALWIPVNLYSLLRKAYGSSVMGALLRTVCLCLSAQVAFLLLVASLLLLGLQQLG